MKKPRRVSGGAFGLGAPPELENRERSAWVEEQAGNCGRAKATEVPFGCHWRVMYGASDARQIL